MGDYGGFGDWFGGGSGLGDMAGDFSGSNIGTYGSDFGGTSSWLGDIAGGMTSGSVPYAGVGPTNGNQGGGGLGDFLSSAGRGFGSVAQAVLPAAQIGAAGLGAYSNYQASQQRAQQSKLAEAASKRQDQISATAQQQAQPLSNFANEQLARAGAGQIQPAIQSQIDEWVRAAKAKANAYAAGSGQGNSSQLTSWLSWIDRQGQAMRAAAIDAQQGRAIQAAGQAGNLLAVGGNVAGQSAANAIAQGSGIDQLLAAANQQLNRLSAATA